MIAHSGRNAGMQSIRVDCKLVHLFWAKVNLCGPIIHPHLGRCWEWTASLNTSGFGQINVCQIADDIRRTVCSHRLAYLFAHCEFNGELHVGHLCGNRICVRHDHLLAGADRECILETSENRRLQGALSVAGVPDLACNDDPQQQFAQQELYERAMGYLYCLDKRSRLILQWRFGLNGTEVKTLKEIGAGLSLTKERIRMIQEEALSKLRRVKAFNRLLTGHGR
jgi:hypothetical protein